MKNRTAVFAVFLSALLLFAGCAQSAQSWSADRLVTYRGGRYIGTDRQVDDVGRKLGVILVSSDAETEEKSSFFSNRYPVGTGLYEIPGVGSGEAIAVEVSPGRYIRADRAKR